MSIPNIKDLQKVTNLIEKVESLKVRMEQLGDELSTVKKEYLARGEAEEKRLLQEAKDRVNLEKIQEEIQAIREEETQLRIALNKEIDSSINKALEDGTFADFVKELFEERKKSDSTVSLLAGDDVAKYIQGVKAEKGQDGQLRIVSEIRDDILDPELVRMELRTRLLNELLPKKLKAE